MTKNIDDLKKEYDEEYDWENDPIKKAIQFMFQDKLCEENYRKFPVTEASSYVESSFREYKAFDAKTIKPAQRLLRRIKKATTSEKIVMILGEYLLVD